MCVCELRTVEKCAPKLGVRVCGVTEIMFTEGTMHAYGANKVPITFNGFRIIVVSNQDHYFNQLIRADKLFVICGYGSECACIEN